MGDNLFKSYIFKSFCNLDNLLFSINETSSKSFRFKKKFSWELSISSNTYTYTSPKSEFEGIEPILKDKFLVSSVGWIIEVKNLSFPLSLAFIALFGISELHVLSWILPKLTELASVPLLNLRATKYFTPCFNVTEFLMPYK